MNSSSRRRANSASSAFSDEDDAGWEFGDDWDEPDALMDILGVSAKRATQSESSRGRRQNRQLHAAEEASGKGQNAGKAASLMAENAD